jgi:hypothetical protein
LQAAPVAYRSEEAAMLRKSFVIVGGLLLLALLFFGRDAFSYISTSVARVHERVKSNVPISFEISRVRDMMKKLDPEVRDNMHRIAREEVDVAKLEREIDRQGQQLAKDRGDIMRLKSDLETGSQQFVYAGRSYNAIQVRTDLANRFAHFKTSEATVDQLKKVLEARKSGLNAAREKLEGMLAARRQLEVEVANLEARLKMVEVAQTTSDFNFDDSQLARTRDLITEISTRLEVAEKLLNSPVFVQEQIPLESPETTEDILDSVTKYFQANGQPEAEAVARSS